MFIPHIIQQIQMQKQQHQISSSTRHRFSQHNRLNQIEEYKAFKNQYEKTLSNTKIQELKKLYPHAILGRSQQSKIVVLDRVGQIKLSQIAKIIDDDTFVGYIYQRLLYLSEHVLKQKQQVIWIIDLSGKVMQLASKKTYILLQKISANCQKYFPGLLFRLYFINTPMLFDTAWSKIAENIDEHTLTKVVHLTDQFDQLLSEVSKTLLPKYLGGSKSDDTLLKLENIEETTKNNKSHRDSEDQKQDHEDQQIDFGSLKAALSGLKLGGNHHPSVANTPLNTEADDSKQS